MEVQCKETTGAAVDIEGSRPRTNPRRRMDDEVENKVQSPSHQRRVLRVLRMFLKEGHTRAAAGSNSNNSNGLKIIGEEADLPLKCGKAGLATDFQDILRNYRLLQIHYKDNQWFL